jgi:hypothetical protein
MSDEKQIWEAYEKKKKLTLAFIAKQAREFLSQKEDQASQLITDCKNTAEMEYRLTWLSEGSLKYHLMRGRFTNVPHGGDPEEKALYSEFQKHLDQFR